MKNYLAELLGTFALVFCGTGAIIINAQSGGQIGHAGIAMTFGLVVMAMIYTFGQISGAHFNPAVTIGFSVAGLFDKSKIIPYIVSQLSGAFIASLLLKSLFPTDSNLGATLPAGSQMQSFILEAILSFILMLVILYTSQGNERVREMAGVAIGGTVLLEAMFAGPVCGASMNPARSIAPAIVSGNVDALWLYIAAPVLGMLMATFIWKKFKVNLPDANVDAANVNVEIAVANVD